MGAAFALASAGVFGAADFLGGYASRSASARSVALLAYLAGAVATALGLIVFGGVWSMGSIGFGLLAGLAGAIGLILLFSGFARGTFQIVSPAAAVMSGLVPVAWGVGSGEEPSGLAIAGLLLAPVGVWILAGGTARLPARADLESSLFGLGSGLGFGVFFVCLAQAPDDGGLVPVIAARGSSIVVVVVSILILGGPMVPAVGRVAAIASGVLDPVANGLFLLAAQSGQLFVVGALVALFPVSNALLARFILKERLSRLQGVGFALALLAGAALAVG